MEERERREENVSSQPLTGSTSPSAGSLSSSPLSVLSKSPSPPREEHAMRPAAVQDPTDRYPSPTTTTPSGSQSPVKLGQPLEENEIQVNTSNIPMSDGPPRKKRRTNPPKPRTTEFLDLGDINPENKTSHGAVQLERLLHVLRKKKKIVVVAGAGISVSAGIPDFRSNTGLFQSLKSQHKLKGSGKHLFDAAVYRDNSSTRNFHTMVRELASQSSAAKPTAFHHLLASLAEEGRLLRLYTQNIDCIDTNMKPLATDVPLNPKGPWPTTIQLHGGLEHMYCTKCGQIESFDGELFVSHEAPLCAECKRTEDVRINHAKKRSQGVGRVRPRIVLYNESNPEETAIGSVSMADLRARPDAILVVGTSLKIPGVRRLVKEFCQVTRGRRDGFTAWINLDPEPQGVEFKDCWDLVVRGKCDDVAELVQLPRWDEQEVGDHPELSEAEEKAKEEMLKGSKFEVQLSPGPPETPTKMGSMLDKKRNLVEQVQGIPTPRASPKLTATMGPNAGIKKQSKILFSKAPKNAKTDAAPTTTRTKLPNKRPPLPPVPKSKSKRAKREAPRSHAITETFKTSKGTASKPGDDPKKSSRKSEPAAVDSDSSTLSDIPSPLLAPVDSDMVDRNVLPALRPRRTASDTFPYTTPKEAASDASSGSELTDPPHSPPRSQAELPDGTVSPGSVPRNMAHLID